MPRRLQPCVRAWRPVCPRARAGRQHGWGGHRVRRRLRTGGQRRRRLLNGCQPKNSSGGAAGRGSRRVSCRSVPARLGEKAQCPARVGPRSCRSNRVSAPARAPRAALGRGRTQRPIRIWWIRMGPGRLSPLCGLLTSDVRLMLSSEVSGARGKCVAVVGSPVSRGRFSGRPSVGASWRACHRRRARDR